MDDVTKEIEAKTLMTNLIDAGLHQTGLDGIEPSDSIHIANLLRQTGFIHINEVDIEERLLEATSGQLASRIRSIQKYRNLVELVEVLLNTNPNETTNGGPKIIDMWRDAVRKELGHTSETSEKVVS